MNRKKIIVFICLSYCFSWLFWGRQWLDHQFDLGLEISKWNHLLGGLGPFFGAVMTTFIFEKGPGVQRFFRKRFFTAPPLKWLLVGIGMPVCFFLVPYLAIGLFKGEWVSCSAIGLNSKVPFNDPFAIWLAWCLFYGLGEESGWRGFLFPEFCKSYKARFATLYTAMIWAPWHLPLFFYDKDFQAMGLFGISGWLVGLIFGSLLLCWLVKQASWILWPVILWHGTFNLFTTSDLIDPVFPAVMSGLVIITALWIARRYGENLQIDASPGPGDPGQSSLKS